MTAVDRAFEPLDESPAGASSFVEPTNGHRQILGIHASSP